jgi:hypothetical protein
MQGKRQAALNLARTAPARQAYAESQRPSGQKPTAKPTVKPAPRPVPQSLRLAEAGAERQALTERQMRAQRKAAGTLARTAPANPLAGRSSGTKPASAEAGRAPAPKVLQKSKNGAPVTSAALLPTGVAGVAAQRQAVGKQLPPAVVGQNIAFQAKSLRQAKTPPEPTPEQRAARNRLNYAEGMAERQAATERRYREIRALNGQPLQRPATPHISVPDPKLRPGARPGPSDVVGPYFSGPDGQRAIGDMASAVSRTLDNPADAATEATVGMIGSLVKTAGTVTGNDAATKVGGVVQEVADDYGRQVGDRVMETGVNFRTEQYQRSEAQDGKRYAHEVYISRDRYRETAQHIREAQNGTIWSGSQQRQDAPKAVLLTLERDGAEKRRREALKGVKLGSRAGKPGYDRDEYPFAVSEEGGGDGKSSVKYVLAKDNRGAGASVGHQLNHPREENEEVRETVDRQAGPMKDGDEFLVLETD